jgi:hypothetical protein
MRPVPRRTPLEAPHKWIRRARRPQAVELGRVPHGFERDLRDANRVRGRAFGRVGEALRVHGVVGVGLVVGGVEVLTVPASARLG